MHIWTQQQRLEAHKLAQIDPEALSPPPTLPWPSPYDPGYIHPRQIEALTLRDVPPGYRKAAPDYLAVRLYKAEVWLHKERTDLNLRLSREVPAAFWRGFWRGVAAMAAVGLFAWQIIAAVDFGAAW